MRVLLMEINQESNSFCPCRSTMEDYKRCSCYEGEEIFGLRGKRLCLGGMMQALDEAGAEIIPGFAIRANAGGITEQSVLDTFCDKLRAAIEQNGKLDGCFFSFHGAHQSEKEDDLCGYVLKLARQLLGRDAVIACSNDLHANITPKMTENADIITGYQTYPHIDHFETGYRAAKLAIRKMRGEKLYMAWTYFPMIQPASGYTTKDGKLHTVMQSLFNEVHEGHIEDFSAFQMQPWLDVSCAMSTVLTIGKDEALCKKISQKGAMDMWAIRHDMAAKSSTVEEAIAAAEHHEDGRPVIISDYSDSPNAGSAGDNFSIAAALAEKAPHLRVAVIVNDAPLVDKAFAAGVGATFSGTVGGSKAPNFSKKYPMNFTVAALSDGNFIVEGPAYRGVTEHIGKTATLHAGNLDIVACYAMAITGDPQLFRHFGVEPTFYDIVIVKACTSFREPYGRFAGKILAIDTLCSASDKLTDLPFKKLSRHFYPFTDCEHPEELDTVYCK